MTSIGLSADVYGSFARFSAAADFVELSALRSPRWVRQAELERRLDKDGIKLTSPLGPDPADAAQSAGIVFDILNARSRILGDQYPFEITTRDGLRRRTTIVNSYRVLLALTIAHAYSLKCADPKELFEGFVERALQCIGLRTTTTGTSRGRTGTGFAGVLSAACKEVGLSATPDAAIVSSAAKDEKVDTLAHLDWMDMRPGRWTFIGQVTIAESGQWEKKASEPKPKLWRRLLDETHEPSPFLAVPHHVEDRHLENLHQREEAVILDRLRFARLRLKPTTAERGVVKVVHAQKVDW